MKTLKVTLTQKKNIFEPLTNSQKLFNKKNKNVKTANLYVRNIVETIDVHYSFEISFSQDAEHSEIEGALVYNLFKAFENKTVTTGFSFTKRFNIEIESKNEDSTKIAKLNKSISLNNKNIPDFLYNFIQTIQTALTTTETVIKGGLNGLKLAKIEAQSKSFEIEQTKDLLLSLETEILDEDE